MNKFKFLTAFMILANFAFAVSCGEKTQATVQVTQQQPHIAKRIERTPEEKIKFYESLPKEIQEFIDRQEKRDPSIKDIYLSMEDTPELRENVKKDVEILKKAKKKFSVSTD